MPNKMYDTAAGLNGALPDAMTIARAGFDSLIRGINALSQRAQCIAGGISSEVDLIGTSEFFAARSYAVSRTTGKSSVHLNINETERNAVSRCVLRACHASE